MVLIAILTVAMSIDAVASSMMRMLLLRTKALARQKSCLCPTLKFSPPSVTVASVIKSVTLNVAPLKCCTFMRSGPSDFEWAPWKLWLCTVPGSSKIPVRANKHNLDWILWWSDTKNSEHSFLEKEHYIIKQIVGTVSKSGRLWDNILVIWNTLNMEGNMWVFFMKQIWNDKEGALSGF